MSTDTHPEAGPTDADLCAGVAGGDRVAFARLFDRHVHPGRTCVVTLCAERSGVVLTEDGVPFARPVTTVAVTYDHRCLNGRDAVRFLTAVEQDLETADAIARLAG